MVRGLFIVGPKTVELRDIAERDLGPYDVRVKTLFSGISHGTEMNSYRGVSPLNRKRFDRKMRLFMNRANGGHVDSGQVGYQGMLEVVRPEIGDRPGYENVGRVVKIGNKVTKLDVDDIVFVPTYHQTASVIDENKPSRLPKNVPLQSGVFVSRLEFALSAILDARISLGETIVVFGLGVIGQLCVQLTKLSGATLVVAVDPIRSRAERAQDFGADLVLWGKDIWNTALKVRRLTKCRGADAAIECSGNAKALQEAIRTVGYESTVVAVSAYDSGSEGLFLGEEFHHNRIRIRSSQAIGVNSELWPRWTVERRREIGLELLPHLKTSELISHTFPFKKAAEAYKLIDKHPEETMQVVLEYH